MQNDQITYIGVQDKTLDLFEGQYAVPEGISYNSYVISDEKVAVMDTVDLRATDEWFENLENALGDRKPDYLIVLHMEPDHASNLKAFHVKYPEAKIVATNKALTMIPQFFEDLNLEGQTITATEGMTLHLGDHELQFIMAPMIHWPEVMMVYEKKEKVLFSADAFGKFGTLDIDDDWACEARRYYFNIVGKYGAPVQTLLKKISALEIEKIFPLHGPMLTENLPYYLKKYDTWSRYKPEDKGIFITYASVYGHTKEAVFKLKEMIERQSDIKVVLSDLTRDDMAEAVEDAFRYDKMVLASVTYDGDMFPQMEAFINHLKSKSYQNRTVAFIENGSWAPMAAKKMRLAMENLKDITFIETPVTIKSAMKTSDTDQLEKLAKALIK